MAKPPKKKDPHPAHKELLLRLALAPHRPAQEKAIGLLIEPYKDVGGSFTIPELTHLLELAFESGVFSGLAFNPNWN